MKGEMMHLYNSSLEGNRLGYEVIANKQRG